MEEHKQRLVGYTKITMLIEAYKTLKESRFSFKTEHARAQGFLEAIMISYNILDLDVSEDKKSVNLATIQIEVRGYFKKYFRTETRDEALLRMCEKFLLENKLDF